jgi:ribulose-phosphate 3-epimerase
MKIWASISSIDLGELVDIARRLEEAGVDGIHVDVSDGVFVPELTFGHKVVAALTSRITIPVEAHLMVVDPEKHLAALAGSGARRLAFHVEATQYPWRVAWMARDLGMQVGLAINPATPSTQLSYLDEAIDFVNVLTTEPDFEGEKLLPDMDRRVRQVSTTVSASTTVQVDGAMSGAVLPDFARAGASEFVVGRALVAASDMAAELASLRQALLSA